MHWRNGFVSGVKGITPGSCRTAQAFMICRDAKSRKRYESTAIDINVNQRMEKLDKAV